SKGIRMKFAMFEMTMAVAAMALVMMIAVPEMQQRGRGLVFLENSKELQMLSNQSMGLLGLDGGRDSGLRPGGIYLANEARFDAAYYADPLTTFTVGWRDPNSLEALLDFIAPPVQVGRMFEFKKAINSESFLSEDDDERAIGADFKK